MIGAIHSVTRATRRTPPRMTRADSPTSTAAAALGGRCSGESGPMTPATALDWTMMMEKPQVKIVSPAKTTPRARLRSPRAM